VRWRHAARVDGLAFSPRGDLLASVGGDRKICVWEAVSGRLLRAFDQDSSWTSALVFSPDGKTVALTSPLGGIRLLNVRTGDERDIKPRHGDEVFALAFAPSGRVLASAGRDRTVHLWDAASGKELRSLAGHREAVHGLAFSPDGALLLSGSADGTLRLWRTATGKAVRTIRACRPPVVSGHPPGISCVAFSPDGRTLAAGTTKQETQDEVTLWEAASGKLRFRLPGSGAGGVSALAFSPDGKVLAAAGSGARLRLWEVTTGQVVHLFPERSVASVQFSPDGRSLASGGWDGQIRLWDLAVGKERPRPPTHRGGVAFLTFDRGGKRLLTVGTEAAFHTAHGIDHGGEGVVCGWDADSGELLWRSRVAWDPSAWPPWHSYALLPDGRTLLVADAGEAVALWDLKSGKPIRRIEFPGARAYAFALSPDGKMLAAEIHTNPNNHRISLRALPSGKEIHVLTIPRDPWARSSGGQLAFSPDGRTLAFGHNRTVRLWDVRTGKALRPLEGHNQPVGPLAFSPDGRLLATGEVEELRNGSRRRDWILRKDIRLFDIATGRRVLHIEGKKGDFRAVAFSPDGRLLAAVNGGGLVRVWVALTGQELLRFEGHGAEVNGLAVRPDGQGLATARSDGTVLVWGLQPPGWRKPARLGAPRAEALWDQLAGPEAVLAYRAAWDLAADPERSVPLLAQRLRPVPAVPPERVARLLADLEHREPARREAAAKELVRVRVQAEPALRRALAETTSAAVRGRLRAVLNLLEAGPAADPRALRGLRALWVLEQAGTPAARRVLARLAAGAPDARLTREARSSLRRLSGRGPGIGEPSGLWGVPWDIRSPPLLHRSVQTAAYFPLRSLAFTRTGSSQVTSPVFRE
jgi:WD40 repeat protein